MDAHICMVESLCYLPETITTLLIDDTPTQNLKNFFNFFFEKDYDTQVTRHQKKAELFIPLHSAHVCSVFTNDEISTLITLKDMWLPCILSIGLMLMSE